MPVYTAHVHDRYGCAVLQPGSLPTVPLSAVQSSLDATQQLYCLSLNLRPGVHSKRKSTPLGVFTVLSTRLVALLFNSW